MADITTRLCWIYVQKYIYIYRSYDIMVVYDYVAAYNNGVREWATDLSEWARSLEVKEGQGANNQL